MNWVEAKGKRKKGRKKEEVQEYGRFEKKKEFRHKIMKGGEKQNGNHIMNRMRYRKYTRTHLLIAFLNDVTVFFDSSSLPSSIMKRSEMK